MENNLCETCEINPVRYDLYLAEDVRCPYCKVVKYAKKSERLLLCNMECKELYWWVSHYITPTNSYNIKVVYCLEKDECSNCGKKDFPEAIFEGVCLDKKPTSKYTSRRKNNKSRL